MATTDDYYEWTLLHVAAEKGHVDVVKVLIQNHADVNAMCIGRNLLAKEYKDECDIDDSWYGEAPSSH